MKKYFSRFLIFALLFSTIFFMSCAPTNSSQAPSDEKQSYTIMFYGAGGGNLDANLLYNISQMQSETEINGYNPNFINITAMFNLSDTNEYGNKTEYQQDGSEYKGTMRWYMTKDGWSKEDNFEKVQTLHNPDVLTDFIKYSVNKFPAKRYILIFNDHGYCFDIKDMPVDSEVTKIDGNQHQRGVIYDNNNGNNQIPLSIFGIEEGIKNSGTKMDLIYFDCCFMGQLEMLYQIKDQTKYVLSSSNPSYSSDYPQFFASLKKHNSLVEAMSDYLENNVYSWITLVQKPDSGLGYDMVLTDMSKMEAFADSFIPLKNRIIEYCSSEDFNNQKTMFKPSIKQIVSGKIAGKDVDVNKIPDNFKTGELYYFDFILNEATENPETGKYDFSKCSYTDVDFESAFLILTDSDAKSSIYFQNAKNALNDLIIKAVCAYEPDFIAQPSLGLMLIDKARFEYDYHANSSLGTAKYPTLKSIYTQLEFDKKTHWSDFFEKIEYLD